MQLTKKILREFKKTPERTLDVDAVFKGVSTRGLSRADVVRALRVLEDEGRIAHAKDSGYRLATAPDALTGVWRASRRGHGFVSLPDADVRVAATKTLGAMHGDTVTVRLSGRRGPGESRSGQIVKVVARANERVIGRFERHRRFGTVVPANDRIAYEFTIHPDAFADAESGDIVEIEVSKWPFEERLPEGKVLRVIGQDTAPGMDITMILLAHKWPEEFTEATLTEAERTPTTVDKADARERLDLRDDFTVTIDGLDAKDFDDAVSLTVDDDGHFKLVVHIADVSHYVKPGSAIDADARLRTTSVYVPDRVVPMLPPTLSNGICSLNPQVDRLTFSVIMDIDPAGEVVGHQIVESAIRSDFRLTYEEVDRHIAKGFFEEPQLERLIHAMELLSRVLEQKRLARGSLNFETVEPKLLLDEDGTPLEVLIRERTPATRMIEETMILTNETVAEFMLTREAPMVYRIHDRPDPDAVFAITKLVDELGYPIKPLTRAHPRTFQALIEYAHNQPERLLINSLMLRAMSRAKYSPRLVPHFGLAAPHYCHFTSPIRRYPDLLVHRLVKAVLNEELEETSTVALIEELDELTEHCSRQEREAEAADREAIGMKLTEYMVDKVGEEYTAVVTGVTNFGLFVALENTAEGLVHIKSLSDDYYRFESERYLLRGDRTNNIYRLGQSVRVKLVGASVTKRELDFIVVTGQN